MAEHPLTDPDIGTPAPENYDGLTRAVRELMQVMKQGDLDRIEVTRGDLHILLCARSGSPAPAARPPAAETNTVLDTGSDVGVATDDDVHYVTSPMVGTYYEAPSPGDPPFVRPGDIVEIGQTIAIVEAMKIMNEIVADQPGTIEEILVSNGETVEYGHRLFKIRPER